MDGRDAIITVRDYGPGMAATIRDRVFTPFCTTKANGIGLGLVLAKELVEAHGGHVIWADAHPGTAFSIRLPLIAKPIGPRG